MKLSRSALIITTLLSLSGAFFPLATRAEVSIGGECMCELIKSCVSCRDSTVTVSTGGDVTVEPYDETSCRNACVETADDMAGRELLSGPYYLYTVSDSGYIEPAVPSQPGSALPKERMTAPVLNISIPGISLTKPFLRGGDIIIQFLPEYIAGVYRYALGIAAILAVVMIMIGGVQYIIGSSTGSEAVTAARTRITNAITGLVLVLSAYLVLYVVNPNLTAFDALEISYVAAIPAENYIEPFGEEATSTTCTGSDCEGVNDWQDCMLEQYGADNAEVQTHLVDLTLDYAGYKRTYKVHKKAYASFKAAFDAIAADTSITYDLTGDTSGGTYAWRAKRGTPSVLSNHSWGTAIDFQPSTNPFCPSACRDGKADTKCTSCIGGPNCETLCASSSYTLPQKVVDIFKKYNFTWLGDPQRTLFRDYMHFDYITGC